MRGCRYSRRQFLKIAAGAAAVSAAGSLGALAAPAGAARGAADAGGRSAGGQATVAIVSGGAPEENVRRAVAALGGMASFVSRGDVVVLKPNIGWDRRPEHAANTDPRVVVALAAMCLAAGAKEVRVFDRTCNDPRRCYVNSGIQAALEEFARRNHAADACRIYHVEDRKFQRAAIPGALALKEWELYRDALDADKIVNVPVAKHHSLAAVTLALKNMMGVMGGNRGQIHYRLSDCLADLHRRFPRQLAVIDATRVLLRNGPSGGSTADVRADGRIIASRDVVAADVVAARRVFGHGPNEVAHIARALESGIGVASAAQIRIVEG